MLQWKKEKRMKEKLRDFWDFLDDLFEFSAEPWKDILALILAGGFIAWCIYIIPHMVIDIKELITG